MSERLLATWSFPKAFLHIDGDSFFASCETVLHPELKGKPVIVGRERGIVTALTYEAKARGVRRGMTIQRVKEVCPECIISSSDYESYSLFSLKMFTVVRRYTSLVEEASIDECFAELTGLRRPLRMSYTQIAEHIKKDLETELGFTFSLGLAPTKTLAKIGSKLNKPSGLTVIPGKLIHKKLEGLPIDAVNGIGECTSAFLQNHGIYTILDFAYKSERWMDEIRLPKPYRELWYELHARSVRPIEIEKRKPKSIMKSRTFEPTSKRDAIYSALFKNIEDACSKARRHDVRAREFTVYLKTQSFSYMGKRVKLPLATSTQGDITKAIDTFFDCELYSPRITYRAAGITLHGLEWGGVQNDLFGASEVIEKENVIYEMIDRVNKRHGKYTLYMAEGHNAIQKSKEARKRERGLKIPYLGEVR